MTADGKKQEVVFFPDYTAGNPYQTLFYSSVSGAYSASPGTIQTALWKQMQAGLDESVIFHLHWEDAIYKQPIHDSDNKIDSFNTFVESAIRFKNLGGVFIWTLHNKAPHNPHDILFHKAICQKLSELADGIHFHSNAAALTVRETLKIDQNKIRIIPHGNYAPTIREHVGKEEARKNIGIPKEKRAFILFGRLMNYKGCRELIQAFQSIDDRKSVLWICGKQIDRVSLDGLPDRIKNRIEVRNNFLPQDELNLHIAASDFAVLPYRDSLTSGSIVLTFSLGRPVITPRLAAFGDLTTNRNSVLYEPRDKNGLAGALRRAISMSQTGLEQYEREALRAAKGLDWQRIQGHIRTMYEQCTAANR